MDENLKSAPDEPQGAQMGCSGAPAVVVSPALALAIEERRRLVEGLALASAGDVGELVRALDGGSLGFLEMLRWSHQDLADARERQVSADALQEQQRIALERLAPYIEALVVLAYRSLYRP
ncbi:MAG: hypothetical protein U1C04_18780 [Hydrogenophaga sp.]|uniref:hypothetical protein n=1 Tax=Hydrogenophaga sp. TaxID=1904254 RepID=UPI002AB8B122|nr:hypothetical protein [Hydrogenophaga sp.]MDZ4282796.1 hypothetical protein [Hydrogenophaga sp.]